MLIERLRRYDGHHAGNAGAAAEAEEVEQPAGLESGQDEQTAEIEYAQSGKPFAADVTDGKFRIGAEGVDVAPVVAADEQDHRLACRATVGTLTTPAQSTPCARVARRGARERPRRVRHIPRLPR